MAATANIVIDAGATFKRTVRYLTAPDPVTGEREPMPVNGWTYTAQWRPRVEDTNTPLVELTGTIGSDATIDIELTPAQTRALPKSCYWGLEIESPDGEVERLVQGKVKVTPELVKP